MKLYEYEILGVKGIIYVDVQDCLEKNVLRWYQFDLLFILGKVDFCLESLLVILVLLIVCVFSLKICMMFLKLKLICLDFQYNLFKRMLILIK